jgi:hypothetical protein
MSRRKENKATHMPASWYCWYSAMRSAMLESASVSPWKEKGVREEKKERRKRKTDSISSMPSPVYQCKNARRLKSCENWVWVRRKRSWMQVLLEMRVAEMGEAAGGTDECADMMELGIHSVDEWKGEYLRDEGREDGGKKWKGGGTEKRKKRQTDEVVGVTGLNREHRVLNGPTRELLSPEDCGASKVPSVTRVRRRHRVRRVEELLSEVRNGELRVRRVGDGGERSVGGGEEMQSRKWHHVDRQFPQIRVELTRETKAGGDARHDDRNELVGVTVTGRGELEGAEADVVEGFVCRREGK